MPVHVKWKALIVVSRESTRGLHCLLPYPLLLLFAGLLPAHSHIFSWWMIQILRNALAWKAHKPVFMCHYFLGLPWWMKYVFFFFFFFASFALIKTLLDIHLNRKNSGNIFITMASSDLYLSDQYSWRALICSMNRNGRKLCSCKAYV